MASRIVELLRKVGIFERLPESELVKISKLLKERKLSANQVLFYEGDTGDAMYIVSQGRVRVFQTDQFGQEHVLAFFGEGQFFGDMAVVTGQPRSGTAQATTDSRVLQLRKDDLDVLIGSNVTIMQEMLRVLAERQQGVNQRVNQESAQGAGIIHGRVTLVFSPRGGSGKSTLALNLGVALAQANPDRVALADLSLLFGHLPMLVNLMPARTVYDSTPGALRNIEREQFSTFYMLRHELSSLQLLPGVLSPQHAAEVSADQVRAVVETLRSRFIHVLVDAGPNFSDPTLAAVEGADEILLLVLPDPATVRDAHESIRVFSDILGVTRSKMRLVVNNLTPYKGLTTDQIQQALGLELAAELPYGEDQPALAALYGMPLLNRWPANPVARAIAALAQDVDRAGKEMMALSAR